MPVDNLFDRYVLFLLLPVLVFLVARERAGFSSFGRFGAGVVILFLTAETAFTVLGTRDYLEWNRKRWQATRELMEEGVSYRSIDGGYEFNGWYGYDPAYKPASDRSRSYWWVVDDEYMIASGPLPGYVRVKSYPFRRLLTGEQAEVVVLRRQ